MLNSIMNYDRLISKVLFLGYDIAESNKSSLSLEIHFIVSASLFQIHKVKEPTFLKRPDSILGCRGHGIFAGTVWLPPRRKQPQTTCSQTQLCGDEALLTKPGCYLQGAARSLYGD